MAQFRLNINKVTKIETLFNAGWLFSDKKDDEIILESDTMDIHPAILRALFIILTEGILNSSPTLNPDNRRVIDFDKIELLDFKSLAVELTKITGIKFSVEIVQSA